MLEGTEADRVQKIATALIGHLQLGGARPPVAAIATRDSQINAFARTNPHPNGGGIVCVPVGIVRFLSDSDAELAFVIAHEIGHTLDNACRAYGDLPASGSGGRSAGGGAILGALFGGGKGAANGAAAAGRYDQYGPAPTSQSNCEQRADNIGFRLFSAAGYNPFAASGFFGRLEMLTGTTSTGMLTHLTYSGNHPMTPDRIANLRRALFEQLRANNSWSIQ